MPCVSPVITATQPLSAMCITDDTHPVYIKNGKIYIQKSFFHLIIFSVRVKHSWGHFLGISIGQK